MHGQSLIYEVDAMLHEHHRRMADRHMAIREEGRSGVSSRKYDGPFRSQWKQRFFEFVGRRTNRTSPEAAAESIASLNQI